MSSYMPKVYPTWCDVRNIKRNMPPIVLLNYLVERGVPPMEAAMMISYPYQGPLCNHMQTRTTCNDYTKILSPEYLTYSVYK